MSDTWFNQSTPTVVFRIVHLADFLRGNTEPFRTNEPNLVFVVRL